MRPLRLWARNYGPFEQVDWIVPGGVTAIVGRNDEAEGISSNGAGKTKLLEILPISLFGPAMSWSEYVTKGEEGAVCTVGCEFEYTGDVYRITRTFNPKGRGKATLDLDLMVTDLGAANGWSPLTRETIMETQTEIERVLGLTEETFQHSVFSKQGARHFADPELQPRERKEILAQALGLGVYDRLLELARGDLGVLRLELTGARGALELLGEDAVSPDVVRAQLSQAHDAVTLSRDATDDAERKASLLKATYEEAQRAREKVAPAQAALLHAQAQLSHLKADSAAAERAAVEMKDLNEELGPLQALAAEAKDLEKRVGEQRGDEVKRQQAMAERRRLLEQAQNTSANAGQLSVDMEALQARAQEVLAKTAVPIDICDRCLQPVAGKAREAVLAGLQQDATALSERADELGATAEEHRLDSARLVDAADAITIPDFDVAAFQQLTQDMDEARGALPRIAAIHEGLTRLTGLIDAASTEEFYDAFAVAETEVADRERVLVELEERLPSDETVKEMAAEALGADLRIRTAREALEGALAALGASEQRLERVLEVEGKRQELSSRLSGLEERQEALRVLERAYGRDGIPALIMESTAIPQLERETERVLGELGVPYRLELRTQATLKTTSERLKDTLEVIVHEPNGERRYETYSGGEQSRINVALRIAFAQLLKHRVGSPIEMFALDEVEHLDTAGVTRLARLLRDLQREIPVVLFVSHVDSLSDAFDNQVVVEKRDGRSHLVEV